MNKCLGCESTDLMEFEETGLGKYCQECFDKQMEIWRKESGWENENN